MCSVVANRLNSPASADAIARFTNDARTLITEDGRKLALGIETRKGGGIDVADACAGFGALISNGFDG